MVRHLIRIEDTGDVGTISNDLETRLPGTLWGESIEIFFAHHGTDFLDQKITVLITLSETNTTANA